MSVLHICTTLNGGAGIAAVRLHTALLKEGEDSRILTLSDSGNKVPEVYCFPEYRRPFYQKVLSRFGMYKNVHQKQKKLIKNLVNNYDSLTFPETVYDVAEHRLVKEADIINLHWVANFIDFPSFFSKINKPIVWTLHDMNPFMGGFHYQNDLKKNPQFAEVENKFKEEKKQALKKNNNLTVVTPSKWLGKCSKNSKILGKFNHKVIPNGIPTNILNPKDRHSSKEKLQIAENSKVVLFSAGNVNNNRKGFKVLLKALTLFNDNNYQCIAMGTQTDEIESHIPIRFPGHLKEEKQIAEVYSAADVFVIPTLEDNLPNTVLESMACGTPVIGSNVGGVPDMVRPGVTGMLFEPGYSTELAGKIKEFFALPEMERNKMSGNCRRIAVEEYSQPVQAKAYMALYEEVLKSKTDRGIRKVYYGKT